MIVKTGELVKLLGISVVRLNGLANKGKIPRGPRYGTWDLEAVRAAIASNLDVTQISVARGDVQAGEDSDGPRKGSYAAAQLKHEQAKARKAELEVRRLEGVLVDSADVRTAWTGMISRAKNTLLSLGDELGDRLAGELDPIRCREMVAERVREALAELAEPESLEDAA